MMRSPPAGTPRYAVVHESSLAAAGGDANVMRSRSPSCANAAGRPPQVTADTLIPLSPVAFTKSSATSVVAGGGEADGDRALAGDLIVEVADGQAKDVVERVHSRLSRIGVGGEAVCG